MTPPNIFRTMSSTPKRVLVGLAIFVAVAGIVLLGLRALLSQPGDQQNPYAYDISALKRAGRDAVQYAQTERIGFATNEFHGIAVGADDRIYLAGERRMLVCDREGKHLSATDLAAPARCIALADNGDVYLGLEQHVEVLRGGTNRAVWSSLGSNALVTSLAVGPGSVYVADAGNHVVWRCDFSGAVRQQIGRRNEAAGIPGFVIPSPYFDVAIGADNSLWVVNPGRHTLENYSSDGSLRATWGKAGTEIESFCGCCNPSHIALMDDGSFVTSEKALVRVKLYAPTGEFRGVVAGPDLFAEGTAGLDLAVDASGRILVLDPQAGMVRVFTKKP